MFSGPLLSRKGENTGDDGNVGPDMDDSCVHTEQRIRVVLHLRVGGTVQVATPEPKRSSHYK